MTTYTLTLPDGSDYAMLGKRADHVYSYRLTCGHRHRKVERAWNCWVPGQPGGNPRMQVVARDARDAAPRALRDEDYA